MGSFGTLMSNTRPQPRPVPVGGRDNPNDPKEGVGPGAVKPGGVKVR